MILCGAVRAIMDWFYVKKEETYKLGEIGDYIQQIYRCEDVTPEILQEMEGILNDGRQIALASLGKSLNERNAQQNEISSKIQQVTEMSKMQETTLTRKREEFAERWSQTSPVRKAISIAIGIICALVLVWCAVSLFRWIIDVRHLFANAMNYGFLQEFYAFYGAVSGQFSVLQCLLV